MQGSKVRHFAKHSNIHINHENTGISFFFIDVGTKIYREQVTSQPQWLNSSAQIQTLFHLLIPKFIALAIIYNIIFPKVSKIVL